MYSSEIVLVATIGLKILIMYSRGLQSRQFGVILLRSKTISQFATTWDIRLYVLVISSHAILNHCGCAFSVRLTFVS